ncbi:MAG TPA: hypothetical protein VMS22_20910 [Candidatus Eisenbacteria bacterium]|nr:hypothetical protein [Candidatus Eisenbacteria bacterium]
MITTNIRIGGLAIALLAVSVPTAFATVAGGGPSKSDCYAVFNGVDANVGTNQLQCKDGDPCDADGTTDGTCTFNISVCAYEQGDAGCTPQPIASYKGNWVTKGFPVPPVAGDSTVETCGTTQQVQLPLKVTKKGTQKPSKPLTLTLVAKASTGSPKTDKDKLKLKCLVGDAKCPANPNGGPSQVTFTVPTSGSDLDTGESGKSHNFITPSGSQLKYCLTGCDESSNPTCQASGATGQGSLNGPAFGPPLPLFSSNVAVCVINRYADPQITATLNIQDGSFDASTTPVNLLADTYQGSATQVCPRCTNGKCDTGRNAGQSCNVEGQVVVNNPPTIVNAKYPVSRDCLPEGSALLGTPAVALGLVTGTSTLQNNTSGTPTTQQCPDCPCAGQVRHDECNLTGATNFVCNVDCSTSTDFKGGIQQFCCNNPQKTPCFPTNPNTGIGNITRTGTPVVTQPAWPDPTYPKKADGGVLASAFCIPPTGAPLVDSTAGLPGPGALLLPGSIVFTK